MSNDIAIHVDNVSKHYLIFAKPEDRLKQMFVPKIQRLFGQNVKQYYNDFAAVRNLSLDVKRGETIGIIGRNGSGKSTLLQMICGTLSPSAGNVKVNGRVAALLELGSGFNPDFSGRENVYLNAAILGLSHEETKSRFAQIAEFADIDQFLDQPVKTYSSGMHVRLAFAVAINVDPDILVIDEALAVGDEAFQRKCYAKIENIRKQGATILFVSHGSQAIIQLCDRAILMDRGEKILEGQPKRVVNQYQKFLSLAGTEAEDMRNKIATTTNNEILDTETNAENTEPDEAEVETIVEQASFDPSLISKSEVEYPSRGAKISNIRIIDDQNKTVNCLVQNQKYHFTYDVTFEESFDSIAFAMYVKTMTGFEVAGRQSHPLAEGITCKSGEDITVHLPFECSFLPGTYSCNCGVFINQKLGQEIIHRRLDAVLFRVKPTDGQNPRQGVVDICPSNYPAKIERHKQTASM